MSLTLLCMTKLMFDFAATSIVPPNHLHTAPSRNIGQLMLVSVCYDASDCARLFQKQYSGFNILIKKRILGSTKQSTFLDDGWFQCSEQTTHIRIYSIFLPGAKTFSPFCEVLLHFVSPHKPPEGMENAKHCKSFAFTPSLIILYRFLRAIIA